jgi:hypothetical protein
MVQGLCAFANASSALVGDIVTADPEAACHSLTDTLIYGLAH